MADEYDFDYIALACCNNQVKRVTWVSILGCIFIRLFTSNRFFTTSKGWMIILLRIPDTAPQNKLSLAETSLFIFKKCTTGSYTLMWRNCLQLTNIEYLQWKYEKQLDSFRPCWYDPNLCYKYVGTMLEPAMVYIVWLNQNLGPRKF